MYSMLLPLDTLRYYDVRNEMPPSVTLLARLQAWWRRTF